MDGETFRYSRPCLSFYLKNKKIWKYKLSERGLLFFYDVLHI